MPIKRAGPIKRTWRIFCENFENEQALFSEQVGTFLKKFRNEQGQLSKQGDRIHPKLHHSQQKVGLQNAGKFIVVYCVNLLCR